MPNPQTKTVAFKANQRNIFLHILTACNLACRHCYINREEHGQEAISQATMDDWLQLFYAPGKENNLIFLGGEPTLHPGLAHGIHTARRLGYDSITVDTNGYLFHDLLERIAPGDAVLSFSLDGPSPEINDPIRGAGVFATCTANLRRAVAAGFKVSLIYTVSRLNLAALKEMPALLAELGVHRFFIQVIGIRGKSAAEQETEGVPPLQLSPEEWLATIPAAARAAAALGIKVVYPKVFLAAGEEFACAGLVAENYFVFPNGRVYLCPLCEDFPVHSYQIAGKQLLPRRGLTDEKLFSLAIPEGCVLNKMLQPGNLRYDREGKPRYRISCCLLKEELDG